MSTDSTSPTATGTDASWPAVRPSSARFVRLCRIGAVLALGYGLTVLTLALDEVTRSTWLLAAVVVGGLVHLTGVAALWYLPARAPQGSATGTAAERSAARRALRARAGLDRDQRRLVAADVAVTARDPILAAAVWALLGPVLIGTPNTQHPLHWLGPVTAAVVALVLVVLALRVYATRALQQGARRADALPVVDDGQQVSYLP